MSWFSKKEKPYGTSNNDKIEILRSFRGLGETFNYLGVEIIVTGHCWYDYNSMSEIIKPRLYGDYLNKEGEIKQIKFSFSELETLKKQNQGAG